MLALMGLLGGSKQKVISVDMMQELEDVGLDTHFPVQTWPPADAVTQLATWLRTAKKYKGDKAFVYVDLKRYVELLRRVIVPTCCV